jgi:hypothetical protein
MNMARKKRTPGDEPLTIKIGDAQRAKLRAENVAQLVAFAAAAKTLVAAEALGIKKQPLEHFWLAPAQRDVLLAVPGIAKSIKTKLAKEQASFTVAEVVSMTLALAKDSTEIEPRRQAAVLLVAKHLTERLQEGIAGPAAPKGRKVKGPKTKTAPQTLFRFKISLLDIKPAIWRRIQVLDCTLADLHEYIQAAFGWDNYHLHQFDIDGNHYGPPASDDFDCGEDTQDETDVLLSNLIPKSGCKSRWIYEYDFGDGWRHAVVSEGFPASDPQVKYPLCVEGERACPPEDCGGPWGYADYLAAIADPKHEQHQDMLEWRGAFDPEAFDAKKATKEMRKVK